MSNRPKQAAATSSPSLSSGVRDGETQVPVKGGGMKNWQWKLGPGVSAEWDRTSKRIE
jgi:hypothetical protein